jgi:hypothetical protein
MLGQNRMWYHYMWLIVVADTCKFFNIHSCYQEHMSAAKRRDPLRGAHMLLLLFSTGIRNFHCFRYSYLITITMEYLEFLSKLILVEKMGTVEQPRVDYENL